MTARGWRVAVGLVAVLAAWVLGPRLLGHVGFFRVREVTLVGVRYLVPDTVINALRLGPSASVFDDLDPLVERRTAPASGAQGRAAESAPPGSGGNQVHRPG